MLISFCLLGNSRIQPRGTMLPAGGARSAVAASACRLLARAAIPRAAAHLHHGHLRADQVRQHQAEDEQQARQPHVAHRVQQLHKAARRAAAASGARALAGRRRGRVLRAAGGTGAPVAGQLSPPLAPLRPPRTATPSPLRAPIESLLLYERGARRDLFFYFLRGRPLLVITVRFSITFCILVGYVDV